MVLVDTSIWIEACRREGDLACKVGLENLLDEYEAAWCSPVRLEFMGGAHKEERSKLAFWFESIPFRSVQEKHWEAALAAIPRDEKKLLICCGNDHAPTCSPIHSPRLSVRHHSKSSICWRHRRIYAIS